MAGVATLPYTRVNTDSESVPETFPEAEMPGARVRVFRARAVSTRVASLTESSPDRQEERDRGEILNDKVRERVHHVTLTLRSARNTQERRNDEQPDSATDQEGYTEGRVGIGERNHVLLSKPEGSSPV
jgi:hypothetical protein